MRLWIFRTTNCLRYSIIGIILLILYLFHHQFSRANFYGIFNIVTVDIPESFDDHQEKNHRRLESISDEELFKNKLKIFFVQTSKNSYLLSRHACSIESAARLHPNASIYVLLQSSFIDVDHSSYIHLHRYANIHFFHFNEDEIYAGTSLSRSKEISRRQFLEYFSISHTSDLIRTALLYKYGGIYFDLDVIPLRPFDQLINTVAIESNEGVNVAAMAFQRDHIVFNIQMEIQLETLEKRFASLCWNCLGPLALTEALKSVCDQHQLHLQAKEKCHQIDIQPSFIFYPIDYQNIFQFFQRSNSLSILNLLKNESIYSIHYFHHMTLNLPIEHMSPFDQLAKHFCPNIHRELLI